VILEPFIEQPFIHGLILGFSFFLDAVIKKELAAFFNTVIKKGLADLFCLK